MVEFHKQWYFHYLGPKVYFIFRIKLNPSYWMKKVYLYIQNTVLKMLTSKTYLKLIINLWRGCQVTGYNSYCALSSSGISRIINLGFSHYKLFTVPSLLHDTRKQFPHTFMYCTCMYINLFVCILHILAKAQFITTSIFSFK